MRLQTFRHLWGITQPYEQIFPVIKKAGYDGIEYKGAKAAAEPGFRKLLKIHQFSFIAQVHTSGDTVAAHVRSFKELIHESLSLSPVLINSQSGRDSWGMDEKVDFIGQALAFEKQIGIPVAHEIHRGRITYNPWETRDFLLLFNKLNLCCDFSHWVCVCERLLQTETDIIKLCAAHCIHLHSRVGYEHGPQVTDPRAPEFGIHLQAHENWWNLVWEAQLMKNVPVSTLTPEFGPPGYQQTLPFSRTPVGNLEEICDWMNNRQKERFAQLINFKEYVTTIRHHSN